MSIEQETKITLVANKLDLVRARRHLAAAAFDRDLRVVSFEERRSRFSTKLDVTVVGHPRRIREFHDDVRGDGWGASGGDLLGSIAVGLLVEGFRGARRKWQGRHDPPLEQSQRDAALPRTIVFWRGEQAQPDGESVGPVWVETYAPGELEPQKSEEWPNWARRSEALAYAREHGFVFFPDE